MKPEQTYFIIGVNGVGKSTVIPHLRTLLSAKNFEIHDFDERGVPSNAGKDWRESETLHWMTIGKKNISKNVTTLICGFSKVIEVLNAAQTVQIKPNIILLDANPEIISKRIWSRYQTPESLAELLRTTGKTPEKFIMDNVWVSSKFREECISANFPIIDTSSLTPAQVAQAIKALVL